jgi:hypothetical protein
MVNTKPTVPEPESAEVCHCNASSMPHRHEKDGIKDVAPQPAAEQSEAEE